MPGDPYKTFEPHDCDECRLSGGWDDGLRSRKGCTRQDLYPVEWNVSMQSMRFHHGRAPCPEYNGKPYHGIAVHYQHMPEDPEQGCPGGWYRCVYVGSVSPYLRQRTEGGGRVSNPRFDACGDPRVIEAVLHFESEQERAVQYHQRQIYEHEEQRRGS